jgi:hypothetical protein
VLDPASYAPELVGGDDAVKAQRLITEITNASRYGSSPADIVARTINTAAPGPLASIPFVSDLANNVLGDGVGTTKLLKDAGGGEIPPVGDTALAEPDTSWLNPGRAMLSKDTVMGWADKGVASVTSSGQGGTLCYRESTGAPSGGFVCRQSSLLRFGGIPRHMGYRPPRNPSDHGAFNQPDVWTFLSKSPPGLPVIGDLFFDIRRGGQEAKFDGRPVNNGIVRGMSALSRAQVYYHRPGAWQEPPNLFNPYWGARLASKSDALRGLLGDAGLTGAAADLLADNVTMF